MTKEELASMLNGRQYRDETTAEIERMAKENGLCIAFAASDDLLEFRGTVYDEAYAYGGIVVYLSKKGNVKEESKPGRIKVTAIWQPGPPIREPWASWSVDVNIPFAPFDIFDDGELYCRGCVFNFKHIEQ